MAKSRTPLVLFAALAWSGAGEAQRANPRGLVEAQQARVRDMINPRCDRDADEITVCGRRDDRGPQGPLPALPYAPEPGMIPAGARAGGEQRAAMANGQCIRLCPQPVRIDPITAVISVVRAIENLRDD